MSSIENPKNRYKTFMKNLLPISFLGLASATLLFVSTAARAAVDGPYVTSTPIAFALTDWSSSLTFPQFNPSLGTLLSVKLDLNGSLSTVLDVTNLSLTASSGTVKTEVQFTVQDGGNNLIPTPQLSLLSPIYAYSLAPGAGATSGALIKNGSSSDTYTLAAILTEFTGAGTFTVSASTFTQTLLANTGGNTSAAQVTDASLTGTVTYNYVPVPEPTSLALAGLGSAAMLFRRRR